MSKNIENVILRVRVNKEEKLEAEIILDELGLTLAKSIDFFLRQVVIHRKLPFEIKLGEQGYKNIIYQGKNNEL